MPISIFSLQHRMWLKLYGYSIETEPRDANIDFVLVSSTTTINLAFACFCKSALLTSIGSALVRTHQMHIRQPDQCSPKRHLLCQ
jgi:hypothetical protein